MREEIGRQRLHATVDDNVPSWQYPYRSVTAEFDDMSPTEFNDLMRAKYEAIQRGKGGEI